MMNSSDINGLLKKEAVQEYTSEFEELNNPMEELTDIFCLSGSMTRFKILYILMKEEKVCVNSFCEIFDISSPAISQHLRKLKDFGLIKSRKSGQYVIYSINEKYLHILSEVFKLYENTKAELVIA
ncbi:MAG: winged helix-turn-helix transcriptional regulator [Bacteroidetes bacterium]|nr:winged helix-turn-helix transcriptional regulator [Bacteroidota bacterium]